MLAKLGQIQELRSALTIEQKKAEVFRNALLARQRLDRLSPLLRDGGMFALKPKIDLESIQSDLMEWESSTRNPDIGWMFDGTSPNAVRIAALKRAGIDPEISARDNQERERRYFVQFQGIRTHLLQVQAELQEATKFPDPKTIQ